MIDAVRMRHSLRPRALAQIAPCRAAFSYTVQAISGLEIVPFELHSLLRKLGRLIRVAAARCPLIEAVNITYRACHISCSTCSAGVARQLIVSFVSGVSRLVVGGTQTSMQPSAHLERPMPVIDRPSLTFIAPQWDKPRAVSVGLHDGWWGEARTAAALEHQLSGHSPTAAKRCGRCAMATGWSKIWLTLNYGTVALHQCTVAVANVLIQWDRRIKSCSGKRGQPSR